MSTPEDPGLDAVPPRSHGVIALVESDCTSCMVCARECPSWCIHIDYHRETLPPETEYGRERHLNVLDRFAIDYSLCIYCGICIETCPADCLHWAPEHDYPAADLRELLQEKDRLGEWVAAVPDPVALDEGARPVETGRAGRSTPGRSTAAVERPERPPRPERPERPPRPERPDRPPRPDRPARPPRAEQAQRPPRPPRPPR